MQFAPAEILGEGALLDALHTGLVATCSAPDAASFIPTSLFFMFGFGDLHILKDAVACPSSRMGKSSGTLSTRHVAMSCSTSLSSGEVAHRLDFPRRFLG